MTVTNVQSAEYANQSATPIVPAIPSLNTSKLRVMPVTWSQGVAGSIGSTGLLARMPQGEVTVWTGLSKLWNNAWAASITAALGVGAYYTQTVNPPVSVAASAAAFRAAATLTSAGSFALDGVDLAGKQTFLSLTGFDITLTTAVAALVGTETLTGYIVYSVD